MKPNQLMMFDLEDFFNFGFQIIELSYHYNHDFDEFMAFIEEILSENNKEKWSPETLILFEDLHTKYLNNKT